MKEIIKALEDKIESINKETDDMRDFNNAQGREFFDKFDLGLKSGMKSGIKFAIQTIKEHLDKQK